MSQKPSNPIPLNTTLGERYRVTELAVETADGDTVLEGKDQVLQRKVSIVVAAAEHNSRLIANARTLATNPRSPIQILDLGNTEGRTYLITSYTRPDTLLDTLLTDSNRLAASSETQEGLGQAIFGDETFTGQNPYLPPPLVYMPISATRSLDDVEEDFEEDSAEQQLDDQDYSDDDYSYEDDYYDEYPDEPDFDDEDDRRQGGVWTVAIAAIILLVIGVAAVFANLNGMVDQEASNREADLSVESSAASSTPASTASSASASPTESKKAEAKFTGVTRLVPSSSTYMADQDSTLSQTIDGNTSTSWASYGFASANFGGAISSFALAYELEEETVVSQLTINQISGSGGSFTVYTNDSASLTGATEVGSGSFTSTSVEVKLNTEAQGTGVKYVIIEFTSAPTLTQPIVSGYNYGIRLAEVTPSN